MGTKEGRAAAIGGLRFMRRAEVELVYGVCASKLHKDVREGLLPPPIRNGASSRWISSEVEQLRDFIISQGTASKEERRQFVADLVARRVREKEAA